MISFRLDNHYAPRTSAKPNVFIWGEAKMLSKEIKLIIKPIYALLWMRERNG